MSKKEHEILHKIDDAVLTNKAIDQVAHWQDSDNDSLNDMVCNLLKAVSFIACNASQYCFVEAEMKESMQHIINLSETVKTIEVFKK